MDKRSLKRNENNILKWVKAKDNMSKSMHFTLNSVSKQYSRKEVKYPTLGTI